MEMNRKAKDAILALVERERDGEQIDRTLLKNVLVRVPPLRGTCAGLGICAERCSVTAVWPRRGWCVGPPHQLLHCHCILLIEALAACAGDFH